MVSEHEKIFETTTQHLVEFHLKKKPWVTTTYFFCWDHHWPGSFRKSVWGCVFLVGSEDSQQETSKKSTSNNHSACALKRPFRTLRKKPSTPITWYPPKNSTFWTRSWVPLQKMRFHFWKTSFSASSLLFFVGENLQVLVIFPPLANQREWTGCFPVSKWLVTSI